MKKYLNRKNITFLLLLVLLVISGTLNWNYNNGKAEKAKILGEAAYVNNEINVEESDGFETLRIERTAARDQVVKNMNDIINNPNTTDGAKTDAESTLIFVNQARMQEADCESVLKTKGIKEVMVSISQAGVDIFVKKPELHPNEVAIIIETVKERTAFSEDMIKISLSD